MSLLTPTIELAKEVQAHHHMEKIHHVVYFGEHGFTIAHTDEERSKLDNLEDCWLHQWMLSDEGYPDGVDPDLWGWYYLAENYVNTFWVPLSYYGG
jgi:hypothetical protein